MTELEKPIGRPPGDTHGLPPYGFVMRLDPLLVRPRRPLRILAVVLAAALTGALIPVGMAAATC